MKDPTCRDCLAVSTGDCGKHNPYKNRMNQPQEKKCQHETIGRAMIEHDGIQHPGLEQRCLDCGKPLTEIFSDIRKEAYLEGWKGGYDIQLPYEVYLKQKKENEEGLTL